MSYQPDLLTTAFKLFGALGFLVALLIAGLYVSRRYFGKGGTRYSGEMIRILSSIHVGVKKSVTMVEVPGAILVLGVTHDHIRLLDKIEDSTLIDQFELPENRLISGSFLEHLRSFSAKHGKKSHEK